MLTQITSLTRNGLKDWLLQRVSAIILTLYLIFILGFIVGHYPISFQEWYSLFHHTGMKAFTILALLALIVHSWVGVWTVLTDYVPNKPLQGLLIILMGLSFVAYFVWAISILWS